VTDYVPLPQRLLATLDSRPLPLAQLYRTPAGWQGISSAEFLRRIAGLSAALAKLGVRAGDRVGIFAPNCPEWHTADFAITGLGAVTVPVYFHESTDRMAYILNDSGARVLFVAGAEQVTRLRELRPQLPTIERVIAAAEPAGAGAAASGSPGSDGPADDTLSYAALIAGAGDTEIAEYRRRAAQVTLDQLATLIYTSGTTGEPKGVMLTHRNLSSNASDACPRVDFRAKEIGLSFLPLAHIYERTVDYMYLFEGMTIAYVERMEDVQQALIEVRPSIVAAVPRFFEKTYANIVERGHRTSGFRRSVFDWALRTAERAVPWKAYGKPAPAALRLAWWLADRLVYAKIREGVGGRIRSFVSGGGPLEKELVEFFWSVGILVYQGYGLTETAPIVSSNWPAACKNGTSGQVIPNVEVRIAADGEIEVRGPCVMQGYYHQPEATREVLSPDGWFRTGDIGYLDEDGYLIVTDRKKDLIKTAGGKFVAPQPIENRLKTSPFILNAVVIGDRRKFVVALLVLNTPKIEAEAAKAGLSIASPLELFANPWTRALIEREVERLTAHLAQYEQIKRFAMLDHDFSFADGDVTYTLKLKRRKIEERYHDTIERLYADVAEPRPATRAE
jgi:long-chain acyl-CoA synthetase